MDKRKFTSKQEREQHIQNFLSSGKTRLSWCQENSIKPSTFGKWLHDYQTKKQEVKFISLEPKQNTSQQSSAGEILIEIGVCKLHVPEALGILFMQQAIKAVSESNVPVQ
jgi:transposase-like protein